MRSPRAFFAAAAVAAAFLFFLLLAPRREAAAQQGVPLILLEPVLEGLPALTQVTHAGDSRLFLVLQRGEVVIWDGSQLLSPSFLDIRPLVSCCGERGLLSIAFHPRYEENGFIFVNYTDVNGNTVVARYRVSADPNLADSGSAAVLLPIPQPFSNHNGGQLQFGPDGYLYVGMGDGGSGNDPLCSGQNDDTLLGKILRIDVDQNVSTPPHYGIPPSNPYVGPDLPLDEIWAEGLRNPWRFSFDRETGDLWIGDVGQGAREEIDFQAAGAFGGRNYGWKIMEGSQCGTGGSAGCVGNLPPCGDPQFVLPAFEYTHAGGNCSVTGGYVYRGTAHPGLRGIYFYGDYCSGRIWAGPQEMTPRVPLLTSFGEDAQGELYLVTENGRLLRIAATAPPPTPVPRSSPQPPGLGIVRTPRVLPPR